MAFQQGPIGNAAIVTAQVTAPPDTSVVSVPKGWIKPALARISWQPAASANGPLSYTVVLDGRRLATPPAALSLAIEANQLGDGLHHVQLLSTDAYGQSTLTAPSKLEIDGQPPLVKINAAMRGRGVTVRVSDALSGVDTKSVSVSFGDGQMARGRKLFRHRYAHGGVYTITVRARDEIGNGETVHRLVSVR